MNVFRLSKAKYAHILSGSGAEKYGGRWNSRGVPMIYTSESRALCTVEIAVHTPLGNLPKNYKLIKIDIPDGLVSSYPEESLLPDWNSLPHVGNTQEIGDEFIKECEFLVLKVPSAVVSGDYNFLINPTHPDFKKVKILSVIDFSFDERLFRINEGSK